MTKTQLIEKVAKENGISKRAVAEMYDAITGAIASTLIEGEDVQLSGFGLFSVRVVNARTGRNPKTNEPVQIPTTRRISFVASKVLKEKMNEA